MSRAPRHRKAASVIVTPLDDDRVALLTQSGLSYVAGVLAKDWENERSARPAPYNPMVMGLLR